MTKYDASSIKVLSNIEGVRKKPAMYVGDADSYGLWTILREVMDNALDECLAGHSKQVFIAVDTKADTYAVRDLGRGIPVEVHKETKLPTVTTVLTTLHAGGKFDTKAYEAARGTHGIGVTCTNALSSNLHVATARDGKWYTQTFKQGIPTDKVAARKPQVALGPRSTRGTLIAFRPDRTIFPKEAVLDRETLADYLRLAAASNRKVAIFLTWNGKETKFEAANGWLSWIERNARRHDALPVIEHEPFSFTSGAVQAAFQWVSDTDISMVSSVAGMKTARGGTHVTGLTRALMAAIKPKKTQQFDPAALLDGLNGVLNINIPTPAFRGQTKEVLATPQATDLVFDALVQPLTKYFRKHKALVAALIERAMLLKKADEDHKAARKLVSSLKGKAGKSNLPAKLSGCPAAPPEKRELYIAEGDSGGGTLKAARNPKYQEVLPLRGKILNVARAKGNVVDSAEVIAILQAVGFNAADETVKYRVGRIILATDSDDDGAHISTLILTVLQKFCPDVFAKGMVYESAVPLYSYRDGKRFIHASTLAELKTKVGKGFDKRKLTRAKGLGELSRDEATFALMDPETRMLRKVEPLKKTDKAPFWALVGEDVQARRDLLGI